MSQKRVEVLMSVMHQDSFDIAHKTKVSSDLLIINQCDQDDYRELEVDGHLWRMIYTTERGLSKSRNMALKHARGDICLLCDDDEELADGYADMILRAYGELADATAIVFNLNRINVSMKKTYYKIKRVRIAPWYRGYGSPMLTFLREQVLAMGISFDERFGAGSEWGGGEDGLFENAIRHGGRKLYEYPATIATIDYSNGSQWFFGYDEKYFYNQGAFNQIYYRNPLIRLLRKLYTCYKLRRENQLKPMQKIHWMNLGARGITKDVTYQEFLAQQNTD